MSKMNDKIKTLIVFGIIVSLAFIGGSFPGYSLRILSFVVVSALMYYLYSKIKVIRSDRDLLSKENSRIEKEYAKCEATLISRSINANYEYPFYEPDSSKEETPLIDKEELNIARKLKSLYGDVEIKYQYTIDGETYISRGIGLIPEKTDKSLALKIKEKFTVFVDKDDPVQSFIKVIKKKTIDDFVFKSFLNESPVLFAIIVVIALQF